jgi:predicted small metal-binding protein
VAGWLEKGQPMAYLIPCSCGYLIRGNTEDELVEAAFEHARTAHPDMVDALNREALLAMAQVE